MVAAPTNELTKPGDDDKSATQEGVPGADVDPGYDNTPPPAVQVDVAAVAGGTGDTLSPKVKL